MATSARRLLLLLCVVCCVGRSQQCRLYLAPSKLPHAGNGIFAGQAYSKHDQVEYGPVLFVPKAFARHWQLMNYVYAFHPRPAYVFVVFGVSMLFNHQDTPNLYHEDEDSDDWDPPLQQEFPYLVTNYQTFLADASVQAGEELFSSYGDEWFSARELEVMNASSMPSTRYSADYLAASGVCISDVSIGQSDLLPGELGVFAERSFQVGDRVTVSHALMHPKSEVLAASSAYGVLVNYHLSATFSDISLLPIGLIGLANHGGKDHNLRVELYFWNEEQQSNANRTAEEMLEEPYAHAYLAYYAVKPIAAGEELTIDYGSAWENSWQSYRRMMSSLQCSPPYGVQHEAYRFLSPIDNLDDSFRNVGWV